MDDDLDILDLTVPGAMGGQETAAHILKTDPAAQLIVSSGYADDPVLTKNIRSTVLQMYLPSHILKLHF